MSTMADIEIVLRLPHILRDYNPPPTVLCLLISFPVAGVFLKRKCLCTPGVSRCPSHLTCPDQELPPNGLISSASQWPCFYLAFTSRLENSPSERLSRENFQESQEILITQGVDNMVKPIDSGYFLAGWLDMLPKCHHLLPLCQGDLVLPFIATSDLNPANSTCCFWYKHTGGVESPEFRGRQKLLR